MIMPVVFRGDESEEGKECTRFFRPIGPKWSVGMCKVDDVEQSEVRCGAPLGNCLFDASLRKYFDNPNLAAKEAITEMANKGYEHMDLHWRHVGLLPYENNNNTESTWSVKPILIDLHTLNYFAEGLDENQRKDEASNAIARSLDRLNISGSSIVKCN